MHREDARRRFRRASWVNVAANLAKIIAEGAVGIVFGSVALVADAAHSVADLVASVVVLIWGSSSYESADINHPHGHARIEPLSALFVGAVIIVLGGYLLSESARGLLAGSDIEFSYYLLGALGFAMADMYLAYWYTKRANVGLDSTALAALAKDCLNDIYTTVAAIIGVVGVRLGFPVLDPIAGALVSLLVIYQGVEIGRENLDYLVGAAPTADKREEIEAIIATHAAVEGYHDLTEIYDGTVLEVEAHIEVDGELTIAEAHDIETDLVTQLTGMGEVGDAHIHLDPAGLGEWKDDSETPSESTTDTS